MIPIPGLAKYQPTNLPTPTPHPLWEWSGGLRMKFHVWGLGLPRGHFGISLSRTHTLQFKTRGFEREPQLSKAPKNNPPTYLPRPLPDGHLIEIASGKRGQFWGPGEGQKAFISCCHQPQTGEPCLAAAAGQPVPVPTPAGRENAATKAVAYGSLPPHCSQRCRRAR